MGEFRWTGNPNLRPLGAIKMTGPSNSEPENKKFVWYELRMEFIQSHMCIFSECDNCKFSLANPYDFIAGVNGFCWNCQRKPKYSYRTIPIEYTLSPPDLGWDELAGGETKLNEE
jgi:hypothetical protein